MEQFATELEFTTPPEPLKLYINARGFQASTMILNDHPEKPLLFWPTIVTEAFALELYLKCLHLIRGKSARGHDLQALYHQLTPEDREQIRTYYDEIVKGHPGYHAAIMAGLCLDIESVLLRSRDTFMVIRYWHEGQPPSADLQGKISNAGAGNLADAIDRRILELQPEWCDVVIRLPPELLIEDLQNIQPRVLKL